MLLENTGSNVIVSVANNLISIATLPFYLRTYGDEKWGIYLWVLGVSGLLASFDFGMKAGLRRFTARFTSNSDIAQFQEACNTTILIILVGSLIHVTFILLFAIKPQFFLGLSADLLYESRIIILSSIFYAVSIWIRLFQEAILEGHQFFVAKNKNISISVILTILVFLLAIYKELAFEYVALLLLLSQSVIPIFHYVSLRSKGVMVGTKYNLNWKIDFKSPFFKFSWDAFTLGLLQMFTFRMDRVIIGAIIGSGAVTRYAIVTKPMFVVKMIDGYLFSSVQPMIAREQMDGNNEVLHKILTKGFLINFLITLPLCFIGFLFIGPFINLWLGNKYDSIIFWGEISALVFLLKPFYGIIVKYLLNTGSTEVLKSIMKITASVNLVVSIVGTFFLGIGGVIVGTLVDNVFRVFMFMRAARKILKLGVGDILNVDTRYAILYMLVVFYLVISFFSLSEINSWFSLGAHLFIVSSLFYAYPAYILIFRENLLKSLLR